MVLCVDMDRGVIGNIMKYWIALALVGCLGCASLKNPNGSINVAQILNDGRWGVMAACDAQYLQPADCTLAEDSLTLADGIVAQNLGNVASAVRQLLVTVDARLAPASRLRFYLDAIIVLLGTA